MFYSLVYQFVTRASVKSLVFLSLFFSLSLFIPGTRLGSERVGKQSIDCKTHVQLEEEEASVREQEVGVKSEIDRVRQLQHEVCDGRRMAGEEESAEESIRRRNLILIIDSIRKEKAGFKKSCREQQASLHHRIDQLKHQREDTDRDQEEREEQELHQSLVKQQEKLNKITGLYAQVCKDVARHERRLDDIPSRSEVTQYQRRFVELYDQIASKHVEAKNFYILYNQLDDTRIQLEKEYNLLNSVLDSFSL